MRAATGTQLRASKIPALVSISNEIQVVWMQSRFTTRSPFSKAAWTNDNFFRTHASSSQRVQTLGYHSGWQHGHGGLENCTTGSVWVGCVYWKWSAPYGADVGHRLGAWAVCWRSCEGRPFNGHGLLLPPRLKALLDSYKHQDHDSMRGCLQWSFG